MVFLMQRSNYVYYGNGPNSIRKLSATNYSTLILVNSEDSILSI